MKQTSRNDIPILNIIIGLGILVVLIALNFLISWLYQTQPGEVNYFKQGLLVVNIVIITWVAIRFFSILLNLTYERRQRSPPEIIVALVNIIIVFLAVGFIVTNVLGMPLWSLTAAGGLIGAAFTIALQGPILDFFAGMVIDIEKPVKTGEWLQVEAGKEDIIGKVVNRNWRTTTLMTPYGVYVTIPNRVLAQSAITNYDRPTHSYEEFLKVQLDYSIPVERAERLLLSVLLSIPKIAKHEHPLVLANDIVPGAIEYELSFTVDNITERRKIRHEVIKTLTEVLHDYSIHISDKLGSYGIYGEPTFIEKEPPSFQQISRRIDLFSVLSGEEIMDLSSKVKPLKYPKGEIIVEQGDEGDSMFLIGEGVVEVYKENESDQDKQEFLAYLGPMNYFGDMALLTGEKRTATVKAKTSLILFEVTKHDMLPLLQNRPEMAKKLSEIVAQRQLATKLMDMEYSKEHEEHKHNLAQQILEGIRIYFKIKI